LLGCDLESRMDRESSYQSSDEFVCAKLECFANSVVEKVHRVLWLTSDLLSDGVAELSRVKTTVKSLKK
jgi:hypothetical protein